MQFGFNSVGVGCSAISDVSSNGGKYGRRRSTLNTGCRPRNGECWAQKHYLPQPWWWCMSHIKAGESCGGAQWGAPSSNVAKLCHPLRTCVGPDVDYVVGCRPRNGECWAQKHYLPQPWWWCMTHIKAGESYGGAQWGAPPSNVAKLCHPLRTCLAPDADYVVGFT